MWNFVPKQGRLLRKESSRFHSDGQGLPPRQKIMWQKNSWNMFTILIVFSSCQSLVIMSSNSESAIIPEFFMATSRSSGKEMTRTWWEHSWLLHHSIAAMQVHCLSGCFCDLWPWSFSRRHFLVPKHERLGNKTSVWIRRGNTQKVLAVNPYFFWIICRMLRESNYHWKCCINVAAIAKEIIFNKM